MLNTFSVPAFHDNYIWVLHNGQAAWVVDPGTAAPVKAALKEKNLELAGVLVTHHHPDHIGGLAELIKGLDVPVITSDQSQVQATQRYGEEDITLNGLDIVVKGILTPGHTLDHICFYYDGDVYNEDRNLSGPALFCGDTLFSAGCGRLFEGSAEQMEHSLNKLKQLSTQTLVYCAHEYTQSNLQFAAACMPHNQAVADRIEEVDQLRSTNQQTIPAILQNEILTNPFLNSDKPEIQEQVGIAGFSQGDSAFAELRRWKDNF